MGKNNKKKQRKILKAQMNQSQPKAEEISEEEVIAERKAVVTEDTAEVRHEIKKIIFTVLILFLIVVAVYLINIKTDIILNAGQTIVKYLNINLQ